MEKIGHRRTTSGAAKLVKQKQSALPPLSVARKSDQIVITDGVFVKVCVHKLTICDIAIKIYNLIRSCRFYNNVFSMNIKNRNMLKDLEKWNLPSLLKHLNMEMKGVNSFFEICSNETF